MLFNSVEFLLFLPIVFTLYWVLNKTKLHWQNLLLLVASYFFYGYWDYRFLGLILLSTVIDFSIALRIKKTTEEKSRKRWLFLSLISNLGLLGVFKYYNFFIQSFTSSFSFFGIEHSGSNLLIDVILPVGISFYTFQTLSYTIDVYRNKLEATDNFIDFATFVSFFPQLVAGPIERASHLLPQIAKRRHFDEKLAFQGMRLIIWGLFKKLLIADQLAPKVNAIFENYENLNSGTLILGAVYFAFQIYGDFSGYSDIAIGTSKLFGIDLMSNFKFPYFSRNIGEFWRRWHISLSSWFKDYLYIPLGGNKGSKANALRNIAAIFLVSGFWHGADWKFVIWGGIHFLLYIPLFLLNLNRKNVNNMVGENRLFPSFKEFYQMILNFIMVTVAWVFFRAESTNHATQYLKKLITGVDLHLLDLPKVVQGVKLAYPFLFVFILIEWILRQDERLGFEIKSKYKGFIEGSGYFIMLLILITFILNSANTEFIYFKF